MTGYTYIFAILTFKSCDKSKVTHVDISDSLSSVFETIQEGPKMASELKRTGIQSDKILHLSTLSTWTVSLLTSFTLEDQEQQITDGRVKSIN